MGLFGHRSHSSVKDDLKGVSTKFLHEMQCKVCPLNNQRGLRHPQMEPFGTEHPEVYILGEAPGETEDRRGKPFVGRAGTFLRNHIPKGWDDPKRIRWNNVVRTRPPKNRTPTAVEIECCRPSVTQDIERTKPKVVIGFGAVPLQWVLKRSGISIWSGRSVPVKIGNHECWYIPILHPSYVMRRKEESFNNETEFSFSLDVKRAFKFAENPPPVNKVHTSEDVFAGVEYVTGANGDEDVKRVRDMLDLMASKKVVGFDYETSCLRPYTKGAKICTVALACDEASFGFALRHRQASWTKEQLEDVEDALEEFLLEAKCRKVVHHLAFEQEWSGYFFGNEVIRAGAWGDTVGQAFVLDERGIKDLRPSPHSLEFLCVQYFGVNIKALGDVDRKNVDKEDLEKVLRYNCSDAKYHRLLYLAQAERLKREGLMKVYQHHVSRTPTMTLTMLKGIPVHQPTVLKFYRQYAEEAQKLERHIADLKVVQAFKKEQGKFFKPGSTTQVKIILKMLKVETEGTDEKVLEKLKHPIGKLILDYRGAKKILSTYVAPLLSAKSAATLRAEGFQDVKASPDLYGDGRIHPVLQTNRVETARTASDSPNSQNFPKRENKHIRTQIRHSSNDYKIVSIDYGQIQVRNVAMESKDKVLIKFLWDRFDMHKKYMNRIVDLYPKWIDCPPSRFSSGSTDQS